MILAILLFLEFAVTDVLSLNNAHCWVLLLLIVSRCGIVLCKNAKCAQRMSERVGGVGVSEGAGERIECERRRSASDTTVSTLPAQTTPEFCLFCHF